MSKKKKSSSGNLDGKHAVKAAPAPMLEEKKTLLVKIGGFASTIITPQLKKELVTFGSMAIIVVPAIFVLSGALVGTDMLLHGRIMPRTVVGGNSIGFVYNDDAANIIGQAAETYLKTPLNIEVNGVQTQITPEELGMQFSLTQTLITTPHYDIRKDNVFSLAWAVLSEHKIRPFITFDSEKAQSVLEHKLELEKFRAQDARISFDKKSPVILAEAPGKILDKTQLMQGLKQSIKNLGQADISVDLIDEQPTITAQDLEPQKQLVAGVIKTPVTMLYQGQKWKFDPSKHLDAVTFTESPTVTLKNIQWTLPVVLKPDQTFQTNNNIALASNPNMVLDEETIHDFLQNEIIAKIDHPTSDVKIYTDPKKNIVIEGKGQNGIKVSHQALVASLDLALSKNIKQLQVPAREEKAKVNISDDLQSLGIKNLIATGHTAFAGSHAGRIKNINVGMSRYNGVLIKPGEIFSFNDHLGPVDGQHGFVQELVIKAEGTVPDYGGGLCQVSSTAYQAALFAGFPIVERTNHSYAVSYYAQILGYGLDGTIYPGVHDVKFKNDSPAAVVVQAYTEGTQAYFKFYGTDDGRKVWLEGPYQGNYRAPGPTQIVQSDKLAPGARKQVEINHTGFDVTWYRHILKDSKETKETLFTRYDAVPAKVLVGLGEAPTTEASVPKT